ncbi:MAG: TenA family transcriptional regulator [Actinomycetota bacterium]
MTGSVVVAERLDRATAERRLLDHPFYRAWAAGELTAGDLGFYSTQYWRQVETFPAYLRTLAGRLPSSPARSTVESNLADEVEGDHAGLWQAFAEGLGRSASELDAADIEPETAACVDAFTEGIRDGSVAFGLGMIYGYESQTPAVAATKIEGLRSFYGLDGSTNEYFELHGELDVEHARELAEVIAEVARDEQSRAEAEAGARAGAEAIWGLLDGVERVRTSL